MFVVWFQTIAGIKTYEPEEDVMLHPPALPCLFDVETRDEFSGELYRRTAAAELFRHHHLAVAEHAAKRKHITTKLTDTNIIAPIVAMRTIQTHSHAQEARQAKQLTCVPRDQIWRTGKDHTKQFTSK